MLRDYQQRAIDQLYKWFESRKYTYDICHLRREDVSWANFTGAHSMISKESYLKQINILKIKPDEIVWISDEPSEKTPNIWISKSPGHKWSYPRGEHVCPEIFFDFLHIIFF